MSQTATSNLRATPSGSCAAAGRRRRPGAACRPRARWARTRAPRPGTRSAAPTDHPPPVGSLPNSPTRQTRASPLFIAISVPLRPGMARIFQTEFSCQLHRRQVLPPAAGHSAFSTQHSALPALYRGQYDRRRRGGVRTPPRRARPRTRPRRRSYGRVDHGSPSPPRADQALYRRGAAVIRPG